MGAQRPQSCWALSFTPCVSRPSLCPACLSFPSGPDGTSTPLHKAPLGRTGGKLGWRQRADVALLCQDQPLEIALHQNPVIQRHFSHSDVFLI